MQSDRYVKEDEHGLLDQLLRRIHRNARLAQGAAIVGVASFCGAVIVMFHSVFVADTGSSSLFIVVGLFVWCVLMSELSRLSTEWVNKAIRSVQEWKQQQPNNTKTANQ